jgi:hypothetical protein
MYTTILSSTAAIASVIGMGFYSMSGSRGAVLIIIAIAVGIALDPTCRQQPSSDQA